MHYIKRATIAVASFCASLAFADSPFLINFNFAGGSASPVVTSPELSVSDFSGGTVSGGSISSTVDSVFSFDFSAPAGYEVIFDAIVYISSYDGMIGAITGLMEGGEILGGGFTSSMGVTPTIITDDYNAGNSGTMSIEAKGFGEGTFSLRNFIAIGTLAAVPEPSTVMLGGLGIVVALSVGFKRRRKRMQVA